MRTALSCHAACFGTLLALALAACAQSSSNPINPAKDGGIDASADGSTDSPVSDVWVSDGPPYPDAPTGAVVTYVHTSEELYSIDQTDPSLPLVQIGNFDCVGTGGSENSMSNVAVSKDGVLYGIASKHVFAGMTIQGAAVRCSTVSVPIGGPEAGTDIPSFVGLGFVPPTEKLSVLETLVAGTVGGDLYQINTTTGMYTLVGSLGVVPTDDGHNHKYATANVGKKWELSGDLVVLENGGNPIGFATVRDCPNPPSTDGCATIDTLVQLDVQALTPSQAGSAPAAVLSVIGLVLPLNCTPASGCGIGSISGLTAYAGYVYGFTLDGRKVRIDPSDASALVVGGSPLPAGFYGAGITALAPFAIPGDT